MACPVTKLAWSEHSQTTAAAISSACPIRPIGVIESSSLLHLRIDAVSGAVIGVSITPGQTALTRIPVLGPAQRAVARQADHAVLGGGVAGLRRDCRPVR